MVLNEKTVGISVIIKGNQGWGQATLNLIFLRYTVMFYTDMLGLVWILWIKLSF